MKINCGKCKSGMTYHDYEPGTGSRELSCMICGNREPSRYGFFDSAGQRVDKPTLAIPLPDDGWKGGRVCSNCGRSKKLYGGLCGYCTKAAQGLKGENRERALRAPRIRIEYGFNNQPEQTMKAARGKRRRGICANCARSDMSVQSRGSLGDLCGSCQGAIIGINPADIPAALEACRKKFLGKAKLTRGKQKRKDEANQPKAESKSGNSESKGPENEAGRQAGRLLSPYREQNRSMPELRAA